MRIPKNAVGTTLTIQRINNMAIDHNDNLEETINPNPLGDTIATIDLNPEQVHTLITEWYKGQGYDVIAVSTEVGHVTTGHGMNESIEARFKGAKVSVRLK
jgi:hypothetical protein